MIPLPIQSAYSPTDPDVLGPFIDFVAALATDYWWVAAIAVLAWYLRWYGHAKREDIKPPAFAGAIATIRHMAAASKKGLALVGILAVGAISTLAFVFNLTSHLMVALPALDPITWAVTVASIVTAGNGLDWAVSSNPGNIMLAFLITGGGLFLLNRLQAMEERRDAADDDGDEDDDDGPMDFLYAYRPSRRFEHEK